MSDSETAYPQYGAAAVRKDGRDRQGRQVFRCSGCGRRVAMLTETPCSDCRFPPDVIASAQACIPRYEDAARTWRRVVGGCWSVDETSRRVHGSGCPSAPDAA